MLPAGGGSRRSSASCRARGSSSSAALAEARIAAGPVCAGGMWPKTEGGLPKAEGGRGADMGEARATPDNATDAGRRGSSAFSLDVAGGLVFNVGCGGTGGDIAEAARETGLSWLTGFSASSARPLSDGDGALLISALGGRDIPDLFVALWKWATRAV
jgi:hypothetical protein